MVSCAIMSRPFSGLAKWHNLPAIPAYCRPKRFSVPPGLPVSLQAFSPPEDAVERTFPVDFLIFPFI